MPPPRRSVAKEIRAIRRALASIDGSLQRLVPLLTQPVGRTKTARRGRKLNLSRERLAALKLQGQYMGFLRNLRPRQKKQVKALKATRGFRAAIRLAKKMARASFGRASAAR